MTIISNDQTFSSSSDSSLGANLLAQFKAAADTVLQAGRDITIHLQPSKSNCPAACRFNSSYKKYMGTSGGPCKACGGVGFIYEQRQTIYMANIRQIKEPFDNAKSGGQDTPAGRVSQKLTRTKTVIESYDHIIKSLGATIDGEEYKLWDEPAKTGFGGTLLYVVTTWQKMDK